MVNLDEMSAGRELDKLIFDALYPGERYCPDDDENGACFCSRTPKGTIHERDPLSHFSTDISVAWPVYEEKLAADYYIQRDFGPGGIVKWLMRDPMDDGMPIASADTVPLLICRSMIVDVERKAGLLDYLRKKA